MTIEQAYWQRFEALLDEALSLPPASRRTFLTKACQGDEQLQATVESWLAEMAENAEDSFMERQLGLPAEALVHHALGEAGPVEAASAPERLGAYALVRELGRGGMATVFLAERDDGQFEDQVALKLITQGLYGEEGIRRFLNERQILAQLRHPHIACLYDGGVSEEGQPYFVMEYVEGLPITAYCDEHQVPLKERLALFLQVCTALQYTHQNLVVHRDVKPSNILVTEVGQVKLLDFGIAKLLSGQGEATLTRTGGAALTPAYAAPEQVKGKRITTATDVYALGVLLYELLSGRRPYQVEGASMEEWVQVICETEPGPPSQAIGRQEDGADSGGEQQPSVSPLSATHRATAVRLQRQLAGDLDTIALKALRKEPGRRYASVEALAGDLERYLEGVPILARRDTVPYRLGKFVRRHRFGVAVAVLLVVLVSGFTWRTVAEQRRAKTAAAEAAVSAAQASEVSGFLVDLFNVSDPYSGEAVRGDTMRVLAFLERGASQIEALSGQGEVQSMLRGVLGRVYQGLGQYEEAEGFFREALAQRRVLYGAESVEVAESMNDLGSLIRLWSGKGAEEAEGDVYAEAEELLREALALRKALLGTEHVDVATTLNDLAGVLRLQGEYAEAEVLHREALAMRRTLLGDEHPDVAHSLNNLALALSEQGEYAEAEALYREALALFRKLLGEEHPDVALSLGNLGEVLVWQGKYAEAEALYREALALFRKLLGDEHPAVAGSLNSLGDLLFRQGKYAEAEALHREVLAMRRKLLGDENPQVATSLNNLASTLWRQGQYAETEALLREALDLRRKLLGEEHPVVATSLNNLAVILRTQGQYAEAENLLREVLAFRRKLFGKEHPQIATTLTNLGTILGSRGQYSEAEALLNEALVMRRKLLGDEHPQVATTLNSLSLVLRDQGKYSDAVTVSREVVALRRKLLGDEHPQVATSLNNLAVSLRDQGTYAEAEALLREALAMRRKLLGEEHSRVAQSLQNLGSLLRRQGQYAEAEALLKEALAMYRKLLGEEHPDVAVTSMRLGRLLVDQGNYTEAETMLQTSFETLKQTFGLDHRETQEAVDSFIALYTAWGKPEETARYQAMRSDEAP